MYHARIHRLIAALGFAGTALLSTQPAFAAAGTALAGASVTFSVTAKGTSPFAYQWYKDGASLSGAQAAELSLAGVRPGDAGTYRVVVSNAAGATTSDDAVLAVVQPPAFATQPAAQAVTAGGAVTFTAAADGCPAPGYQWRKDGVDLPGATGASFTMAGVTPADAGIYTVVASNAAGTATSEGAALTVYVAPVITTQPAGRAAAVGATVSFTVVAAGWPAPTCQWRKNGVDIPGATNPAYTIACAGYADAAVYTAVASNSAGSVTSEGATLAVGVAPVFTAQPVGRTVNAGATVTLTAAASGTPAPAYQWYQNGAAIAGATSASLRLTNLQLTGAGSYNVVASNCAGSATSNNAVITVNVAPVFTTQPANKTVVAGATVTFTAVASGAPAPTYQWRKGGVPISGATGTSYVITAVTPAAAGLYTVVASNVAGSRTSISAVLNVNVAPIFTLQPASQTVLAGGSVTLTAAASGSPAPTYRWRKNGTTIAGATGASYAIACADLKAAGTYSVAAANSVGSVTSAGATLTVATLPPDFTLQPASWTVKTGATVTFSAAADGAPAPTFQWRKNGIAIAGATGSSYTIAGVTAASAGTYSVVANNCAGSATSSDAVLRTVDPTAIVPADFDLDGHADLVLQNRATGERVIWLMNGTSRTGIVSLGVVGADWSLTGVGDYNADGNPDLFWQNSATGECAVWRMNRTAVAEVDSLGVVSSDWRMAAIGDVDGDGRADIVWQNRVTGERSLWITVDGHPSTIVSLGCVSTDLSITAAADLDGDGHADILWENTVTGERSVWLMNGPTPAGTVSLGTTSTAWSIVGTGDFNGDGDPDILLENSVTGEGVIWPMRGPARLVNSGASGGTITLGTVGPDWWIRN